MTSRTVFAAIAAMVCICGNGRDMPIQNGRLVNALNANQNMITNLPPEFWEGHTGGGADTNAVRSLIDASFVGGTNAVNTALGSYVTEQAAGAVATNTVDAKVAPWAMKGQPQPGGGGADTNAVNDLIREYDTTNLTARINYRTTTNDVNAIIASSNLCTVAAAQAMTTGLVSKAGSTMNNGATLKFQVYDDTFEFSTTLTPTIMPVGIGGYLSGVYGGTFIAYENWGSIVKWYGSTYQTLPEYIDSLSWRTTGNRTLANYGITDAYTKTQVDAATNALYATTERKFIVGEGLSMTNRTVYKWSRNNPDFTMYTATVPKYDGHYESVLGYLDSDLTVEAYIESQGGTMRAGVYAIYHDSYMWNNDASTAYYSTTTGDMKVLNAIPAIEAAMNMTNGVRTYADAAFAPKLTGKTYDFANGVNFTKNLYTALTNVIQTLGGTVTNPPNFD